jgi:hypothetical protein
LTETFAAGAGAGNGTLIFNGQTYPFLILGSVVGPGMDRMTAAGKVYKLTTANDFGGRYTQGSDAAACLGDATVSFGWRTMPVSSCTSTARAREPRTQMVAAFLLLRAGRWSNRTLE